MKIETILSKRSADLESEEKGLSPQHKAFCLEFIKNGCRNATAAYKAIYPKAKDASARANAAKLLTKTNISAFINKYQDELWKTRDVQIGKIFDNLLRLANADIADVCKIKDGQLYVRDFSESDTSIIAQINQTVSENRVNTSIKMHDKIRAISELIRILAMIPNKNDMVHAGEIIIIKPVEPEDQPEEGDRDDC